MRALPKAALLALALALSGPALAQTKKELVAKLIQLQQASVENIGRSMAAQMAQRELQAAAQAMPGVPADKREAVGRDIQADVKKFHAEMEPLLRERALRLSGPTLTPLYEEKFTEDELKQIVAWLESPVSRKFSEVVGQFGNMLAEKVFADAKPTVESRLKALEGSIAKRLGVPAPAQAPAATPARPASGAAPKK